MIRSSERMQVHMEMESMLRKWHKSNPLRHWQMNSDLSQDTISQVIGISPRTWQCWVTGLYPPNKENWEKIIRLTGDEDLPQKWDDWFATKPDVMALVG